MLWKNVPARTARQITVASIVAPKAFTMSLGRRNENGARLRSTLPISFRPTFNFRSDEPSSSLRFDGRTRQTDPLRERLQSTLSAYSRARRNSTQTFSKVLDIGSNPYGRERDRARKPSSRSGFRARSLSQPYG